MILNEDKLEIRNIQNGDWYWIQKTVIQKFAKKIGAKGVVVYNFLASLTDRNQSCFPSQKYIAERLGYSRATVNKAIKLLEKHGLIRKVKKSRYHCVYQLLRCKAKETQVSTERNSGVNQRNTNDNKLTRNINNIDVDNIKSLKSDFAFKGGEPQTREELLALDLAVALQDIKGLPFYLSLVKEYPEALLRKVLSEVKEIPPEKIKKSRGALFNHLIQKYAQEAHHNLSD